MNTRELTDALAAHPRLANAPRDLIEAEAERLVQRIQNAGPDEAMADLLVSEAVETIVANQQASETQAVIDRVKTEYQS